MTINGPVVHCPSRSATAEELRRLADQVESGYAVAFRASMQMNGLGMFEKTTSDEPHPDAPPDVEPFDPVPTAADSPRAKREAAEAKEDPSAEAFMDLDHLKGRP